MADAGAKVLRGLLDVFVLGSLEQAPKHGYALLREMAEAFGTEPNRNRLYPLLGRMVQDGLIAERSDPLEGGTARILYQLTDAGRAALDGYRKLPPAFHERIERIWGDGAPRIVPVVDGSPSALVGAQAASAPRSAAGRPRGHGDAPPPRMGSGVRGPAPVGGDDPPYPCEDARVSLEKDVRSGELRLALVGCPMGAYEYCPLCPVHKAVEGLRRLTLG